MNVFFPCICSWCWLVCKSTTWMSGSSTQYTKITQLTMMSFCGSGRWRIVPHITTLWITCFFVNELVLWLSTLLHWMHCFRLLLGFQTRKEDVCCSLWQEAASYLWVGSVSCEVRWCCVSLILPKANACIFVRRYAYALTIMSSGVSFFAGKSGLQKFTITRVADHEKLPVAHTWYGMCVWYRSTHSSFLGTFTFMSCDGFG